MPLQSVLHTSLSGMSAATAVFDAVGQNVANMRTQGYKSVRPTFAAQAPAIRSVGGGQDPAQVGLGVRLVGFETDLSPGPLVATRTGSASWDDAPASGGWIEASNVDLGDELVEMFLGTNQFRSSARVFAASTGLLDELLHLGQR
jgi:flagellar hook protein FlgE